MNCHVIHRDGRRTIVPRPCLLPSFGRMGGAPRICRSSRIALMRELRALDEQPESKFADADELAKFLAEWEHDATDAQGVDHVTVVQWVPGLLAIVTVGSPEFVDRQLAEQAGFDDAILATQRMRDGVAACVVIGWSMTAVAVKTLNRELNRNSAERKLQ